MSLDPNRVKALFVAALDLPAGERTAFVARECGADAALRARLDELIAAHDGAATVDAAPGTVAYDPDGTRTADPAHLGAAGEVIGERYHLIDEVGVGGMGSVWRAEQRTPVKRYVAVKLIKPGMDSKAVLARFDAERQALAVMDHPNIARVFDGGVTADGRPYFVMELVKGTPITTFADARKLTPRQRLELFVPVCSAIQHAHMKGVIHRDIKPSNVLVALYDDKAVPKVIDFGVAKATGAALTDHTLHTGLGAVVGTPEYMSPEQASLNNLDIDTRSDVYALGVLLYELLTGSPPFTRTELEVKGLLEMLRVVREDEPLRPSVKLSTAAAKPSIAASRGTEPTALGKLLRSELDWLVMKALEKDRDRRYDSANGFAADVNRYLAGEAVQAVPPSLGYRVRKWIRKNRGLVTTSGLVAASLLAGTGVATWQAIRAEQEAERVRQEQAKTKDALEQSEKNREQAEVNLVNSYLRPIGFTPAGFDQVELIALDEVARQENDQIKLIFLREAMSDPERALRVARRAERVVQAAVGTSLKRRVAALKLTSEKQRDTTADPRVRLAACWLAIELGSDDLPTLSEGLDTLVTRKVSDWDNFVNHLPTRIHPTKQVALADALVDVLGKADRDALYAAGCCLAAIAPRLDPTTAGKAFDAIVGVLTTTRNLNATPAAGAGLGALAPRLDPAGVGQRFDALVGVLCKTTDTSALLEAKAGLSALAPRLDPAVVDWSASALADVLVKSTDESAMEAAAGGLAALAPRLAPPTAAKATAALVGVQDKTTQGKAPETINSALAALAPRLDPTAAATAADALVIALRKATNHNALAEVVDGLAALAPRLDPAARINLTSAADVLVGVLGKVTDGNTLQAAGLGLAALAPWLDPPAAAKSADALLGVLSKTTDYHAVWGAVDGLVALAPQLDSPTARATLTQAADTLVGVLGKSTDFADLQAAANGLEHLAPRLDSFAAVKGLEALVAVLGKTTDVFDMGAAGDALAALAHRLDSPAAVKGLAALVAVLDKTTDGYALWAAGYGLAALAPRLDPVAAAKGFDSLLAVLGKATDRDALRAAGDGLAVLGPRLDPVAAAKGFDSLLAVLGTMSNGDALRATVSGLAALAPRFHPATAHRAAGTLLDILDKTTDYQALQVAGTGLTALAPKFDTATAGRAFDALEEVHARLGDDQGDDFICVAVLELLPRFAPAERNERLHRLLRGVMRYSRQWEALTYVEQGDGQRLGPRAFLLSVARIKSVPFLAELLRDPGCYGEFKDAVMLRLEQLAYPEPAQAAVVAGLAADPLWSLTLPALQKADDDRRKQNRRFRTVSDAARWLAEHHPEIDLDTPYHKATPAK